MKVNKNARRLKDLENENNKEDIFIKERIGSTKIFNNNDAMTYEEFMTKQGYKKCRTRIYKNKKSGKIVKRREFFINKHYLKMKELETIYYIRGAQYKIYNIRFRDISDIKDYLTFTKFTIEDL